MSFPPLPVSDHPSLTGRPIPPKPSTFSPAGAPSGAAFGVDLSAFKDNSGGDWWRTRPIIKPRIGIVHTNAASVEASLQSQINWANSGKYSNTHPHWCVNEGRAVRMVPANRRSIANSTPQSAEDAAGVADSSFWTTSIETRDSGTNADPAVSDFLEDDAELVAQILAYDSLIPGQEFPIKIPLSWTGTGVVTHTWPYDGVYTIRAGKICPGTKKKATFRDVIVPRAAQIRDAWSQSTVPITPPTDEGDDMTDAQLKAITDRLDKIAEDTHLLEVRVKKIAENTGLIETRTGYLANDGVRKLVSDLDRLADKLVGPDNN